MVRSPGARTRCGIAALIVVNTVILGLETSAAATTAAGDVLRALDWLIVAVFVAEILAKLAVFRLGFFRDPWNVIASPAASDCDPARIFVAIELSKASWLVAVATLLADKISLHQLPAGAGAAVVNLLAGVGRRAAALSRPVEIVSCYEADRACPRAGEAGPGGTGSGCIGCSRRRA